MRQSSNVLWIICLFLVSAFGFMLLWVIWHTEHVLHLPDVTHSCDMGLSLHAISKHRMHVCTFKKLAGNLLYSSLVVNPVRFLSLAALATKSSLSPAKEVHVEQGLPTASSRTCNSLGCRLAHAVDVHNSRRPTDTIGSYTRQAPPAQGSA